MRGRGGREGGRRGGACAGDINLTIVARSLQYNAHL